MSMASSGARGTTPDVLPAATRRPQSRTPARLPGSIRRSSHIGVQTSGDRPDTVVHGAVRDVRTDALGDGRIVGEANLDCIVASDRSVTSITSDPRDTTLSRLVGRVAHRGWRAAAREVVGADSPLSSLLDDVPIALLLSSYGALRQGSLDLPSVQPLMQRMRNLCAGWASDATPMRIIDAGEAMPLPGVVPVPGHVEADPLATEPRLPLVPGEVRRIRRLDVVPGATVQIHASFRDTWCDAEGVEGVLHEYVLTATLDADRRVASVEAEPRVLPYTECSLAAASPARLIGQRIEDVAAEVKATADTTTCTHLDDLLRSLGVVPVLLGAATAGDGG
jgi:acetolactate synthase regulatory subunit